MNVCRQCFSAQQRVRSRRCRFRYSLPGVHSIISERGPTILYCTSGSEQEGIDRLAVKSFEALLELSRSLSSAAGQPTPDQVSPEVRPDNSHISS